LKIYIAGPYSADTAKKRHENVIVAIDAGLAVWKKGHYPYIPHLTHFVDHRAKITKMSMEWTDYIAWDRAWLESCDALLFLGSSKGSELELEYAKQQDKKIFFNVNSIPISVNCEDSSLVIER
jgi:hypothetical protein